VADRIKVFLDTSALFSAVHSETGGARLILKLGEAGAVELWTGPWVLREAEAVLERKSPSSKPYFALLLDRSHFQVGP
jgi:predicted nucleic acid-binding protein